MFLERIRVAVNGKRHTSWLKKGACTSQRAVFGVWNRPYPVTGLRVDTCDATSAVLVGICQTYNPRHILSSQMNYLHILPVLTEVFGHESSVALVGGGLAAQEARFVHELLRNNILNPTFNEQLTKSPLVPAPINVFLPVSVADVFRWREIRSVSVPYTCNLM